MPSKCQGCLAAFLAASFSLFNREAIAQNIEHDRIWAQSQAAYIAKLGVSQLPESPQFRTNTIAFETQGGRSPVLRRQCLAPANLAYSEIADGVPTVIFCANNLQYVYRGLMPYLYSQFYDHDRMMEYADNYRAFIYEVALINRAYFRGDTTDLRGICDYRFFIFLKLKGLPESACYFVDSPQASDFVSWSASVIDHTHLDSFRSHDGQPIANDQAETNRLYQAVASATLTIIVRYALLHEVGHLQHGDALSSSAGLCEQVKMEQRADAFAELTMLDHRLIDSRDQLLIARLAWAVTSVRLSSGRLGDAGGETAAGRIFATVDEVPRILERLRREQPGMVDQVARGLGAMDSMGPAFDQLRGHLRCH